MPQHSQKAAAPATARPFDPATPLFDGHERPFAPRVLGHAEFRQRDVYRFYSPKEDRPVDVCGPFELAYRLQLEFDPDVTAIVERPRKLAMGLSRIELTFWFRERTGRERFTLLVPDVATLPGPDGIRRPRQIERLRAAARDSGISLEFVTEDAIKSKSARCELYYHLLGPVQSARALKAGLVVRQEVLRVVELYPRVRVAQVVGDLGHLPASHVHLVIAELLFLGAVKTDATARLTEHALLWRTPV